MKAQYFTKKNMGSVSRYIIEQIEYQKEIFLPRINPDSTALIILDMQRYFLEEDSHAYIPSASVIIPNIIQLAELFLEKNFPVILTKHINTEKDAGQMEYRWKELISRDNPLSEIIPDLNFTGATVIEKTQYDAFFGTNLEQILKNKNIGQLVFTGVMTHLCCETTVRSAFVRDFTVFFPVDGTATYNIDYHTASFRNLTHGFITPITCNDLIKVLKVI